MTSLAGPVTRLVWSTLADIPQNYHVVKALALLCSWPFPTSSTSTDPTFMLCGMMSQVAMQLGLHRPSHTQDFSKFRVELIEEELRDKVRTWAICNIVAQRYVAYPSPCDLLLIQLLFLEFLQGMVNRHLPCMIGHCHRATLWIRILSYLGILTPGWKSRNFATKSHEPYTPIDVIL